MNISKLRKWLGIFFLVLLVNSAYIWAFAFPSVFYMTNVLLHLGLGVVLAAVLVLVLRADPDLSGGIRWAVWAFRLAFLSAAGLVAIGNTTDHRWLLIAHEATAVAGVALLLPYVWRQARQRLGGWMQYRQGLAASAALLVLLPPGVALFNKVFPNPNDRIRNPMTPPAHYTDEGEGPKSPFFPSSSRTDVGGIIPSNFFMDSEACKRCHSDIFEQWKGSMHHFSSLNNQFYRKAIEYMQDTVGVPPSRFCGACHDHAVFFNGRFEKPLKEQVDTLEAHAGLACTSCHAIVAVGSTMGNTDFTIHYPPLHAFMTSKNKYIQAFDRFLTFLNPEPHRRNFIKPFMRKDAAEYCSACHKVHLDVPINSYRWLRGTNDYDAWQASGVSGQGARSFYYPKESSTCVDCHMPQVASRDEAAVGGKLRSHRFNAANTAVPFVNGDHEQMAATQKFLTSGFISVDIFAVSPVEEKAGTAMVRRLGEGPQAATTVGSGEEAEQSGVGVIREVGKLSAPIDVAGGRFKPGSTVRVDVVVRTRKIGHLFPAGTVDSADYWLELQGKDADGRIVYWSGQVEDDGKGEVEPGAHFYKALQLDGGGNPINKRNAWQARTALYVHQIPPGAADVVHYRVAIPKDARGPITLTARLNHRKFNPYYTRFSYAGTVKPGQDPSRIDAHHNDAEYSFDKANIPANVSGKVKGEFPVLPITVLASATSKLEIGDVRTETRWTPVVQKKDRERWNDWGIGLLLQGDLKAAEYAFKKVIEAEPEYADGWLNVARALVQEGEIEAAKPYVVKALQLDPKMGRGYYFKALAEKSDGDYDAAIQSLRTVVAQYPRDRVVLNQLARILFLKREYREALKVLDQVCQVDPEDLQAHYTAMLCYRGLNDSARTSREQKLFQRFKAEEASVAITGKRRMVSPEDNNERQAIHDHDSVRIGKPPTPTLARKPGARAAETVGGGGGQ